MLTDMASPEGVGKVVAGKTTTILACLRDMDW